MRPPADLQAVVSEFGRLLEVLGVEVAAAVHESHREYLAVGDAFQGLGVAMDRIGGIVCAEPVRTVLACGCAEIGESLDAAVVALQYHDRLAQRLGHIRASLDRLQSVLRDGTDRSHEEWLVLLREVERAQAMEQKRLQTAARHEIRDDSVELF